MKKLKKELQKNLSQNKKLESILNLWKKIKLNSNYPISYNKEFYIFDKELSDSITKNGSDVLKFYLSAVGKLY